MGLKADVEEVSRFWQDAPWRVKIFLGLSFFLSTSSIASLSDSVFRWKGFALEALIFYRAYVAEPIGTQLTQLIGRSPPQNFFDATVIFTLVYSGVIRIAIFRPSSLAQKVCVIAVYLAGYGSTIYILLNPTSYTTASSASYEAVWISYPLLLICFSFLTKGAERILLMSYMAAPVLVVAILGATSAGLSR